MGHRCQLRALIPLFCILGCPQVIGAAPAENLVAPEVSGGDPMQPQPLRVAIEIVANDEANRLSQLPRGLSIPGRTCRQKILTGVAIGASLALPAPHDRHSG